MSLNTSIIMGRLTKDVEIRSTQSGRAVTRFTVAVDSKYTKDKTNFIPCAAWGKTAEFIGKYFGKGSMICLEGELVTGKYPDKETGKDVYTMDLNVERANFTGERRDSGQPVPQPPQDDGYGDFAAVVDDDELPF